MLRGVDEGFIHRESEIVGSIVVDEVSDPVPEGPAQSGDVRRGRGDGQG
jgi:hypothetical protein